MLNHSISDPWPVLPGGEDVAEWWGLPGASELGRHVTVRAEWSPERHHQAPAAGRSGGRGMYTSDMYDWQRFCTEMHISSKLQCAKCALSLEVHILLYHQCIYVVVMIHDKVSQNTNWQYAMLFLFPLYRFVVFSHVGWNLLYFS